MLIQAGTVGLVNPPQVDVVRLGLYNLSDTGEHPSPGMLGAGWSGVVYVDNPVPLRTQDPTAGGRLEDYPVSSNDLFNRMGIIQVGNYMYSPEVEAFIPLSVLSSSAMVVVTPQQEALEELLSMLGAEDFFMAPPLWIDIEMGEEGEFEEEVDEEADEFTYLQRPYLYRLPGFKKLIDMPTLLGEEKEEGLPRLSYLRY